NAIRAEQEQAANEVFRTLARAGADLHRFARRRKGHADGAVGHTAGSGRGVTASSALASPAATRSNHAQTPTAIARPPTIETISVIKRCGRTGLSDAEAFWTIDTLAIRLPSSAASTRARSVRSRYIKYRSFADFSCN